MNSSIQLSRHHGVILAVVASALWAMACTDAASTDDPLPDTGEFSVDTSPSETDSATVDTAVDTGVQDSAQADTVPEDVASDVAPTDTTQEDTASDTAPSDVEEDRDLDIVPGDVAEDTTPRTTPSLPPEWVPEGDEFMVVMLPDTQIYALRHPETFESQLKWVAEHASEYRIVFVSHVGDIVQNGNVLEQWAVARGAYDWLDDIDLPYGFSIGGHDNSISARGVARDYDTSCSSRDRVDCEAIDFKDNFGAALYAERPWFGGASPSGLSSYQLVEVEGLQLLFLHMLHDTPEEEVQWAGEVLDAHPGTLVHLTTHRYLFDYRLTSALPAPFGLFPSGRFNEAIYSLGGEGGLRYLTGLTAGQLWSRFISTHPNIWGVHCGHVDAEFHQRSLNSAGLPVYEVLIDYQNMDDGGGGWLRLLTFKPSENRVEAVTFSTLTGELRGNGDGFDHSINILDDYKDRVIDDLEELGILTREEIEATLELLRTTDSVERMDYYDSLYSQGSRDSRFIMEVDFQAYIDASR